MRLNDLGLKYVCDKSDIYHTHKNETYLDIYENYFNKLKDKPIRFLELGVRDGKSMRIWENYFTNSQLILGIDIMPSCKIFQNEKIKIEIGSQADTSFLNMVGEKHGPFDIILDDASHINELSIVTFNVLKNFINEGGYYIIEDLRNSYEDLTEDVKLWPGMHLNSGINFNNSLTRENFNNVMFDIIKDLDYRKSNFRSVNFHSQLVGRQPRLHNWSH